MKMELIKYFLVIILLITQIKVSAGEIRDIAVENIIKNFEPNINIETYKFNLNTDLKNDAELFARQRFWGSFVYYYKITLDGKIIGHAILDNVLGKVKPITFLVIFNHDNSVKSVIVVKYREQYGGGIADEGWLQQFSTKTLDSNLELNDDIDGISGATISVKSITKGVKRLLYFVNNLSEDERNLFVSIE